MNARMNLNTSNHLQQQADTCSAVALLFIETSGKYFDLHMETLRSNLEACRQEIAGLSEESSTGEVMARFSSISSQAMLRSSTMLREAQRLAAGTQAEIHRLVSEGHEQWRLSAAQAGEHNLRLLKGLLGQFQAA